MACNAGTFMQQLSKWNAAAAEEINTIKNKTTKPN